MFFNSFDGFLIGDFEAYSPKNSILSIHNSKRFLVRNKLESLGSSLENETKALDFDITDPTPSVWNDYCVEKQILFFLRKKNQISRLDSLFEEEVNNSDYIKSSRIYHRHIIIAVKLDYNGVHVYLHLNKSAMIDYKNLLSKLEYEDSEKDFDNLLEGNFDFYDEKSNKVDKKSLYELINNRKSFSISKFYDKNNDLLGKEEFLDEIKKVILELKPIYDFIAWVPEDDIIDLKEEIKEKDIEVKKAGLKKGDKVIILSGIFAQRTAILEKINKRGKASININGIRTDIDASQLKKL